MQSPSRLCRTDISATWLALSLALLVLAQPASASDAVVKQIYNNQGNVGNISLGMKFSILKAQDPNRLQPVTGVLRDYEKAYKYTFSNGHSVVIGLDLDGTVSYIRITDPYFATEKGIRVGDAFSKVRQSYPEYECFHGAHSGRSLTLVDSDINRGFEFDTAGLSDSWLDSRSQDCSALKTQRLKYISISTPR
ncbi:MAG TPA: hypothetical protein VGM16_10765 [Gammaproteobacteria bacterium]|jgi:hypothetical protein